jgi:hypothetical protein
MQYKTICLQMIQDHPELYNRLLSSRTLLPTLACLALLLRDRHAAWKDLLSRSRPGSSESQIASEALELGLKELEDCLSPVSPPGDSDPLSLDEAMAFLRRHTPPA